MTKLKRTDRGRKKIQSTLAGVRGSQNGVKVGLVGGKKAKRNGTALTNAEVALMNEFGTATSPARPFIGPAFRRHKAEYTKMLANMMSTLVRAGVKSYPQALGLLGAKAAADFKNFVTQGDEIPPPNAPSTLARKLAKGAGTQAPRTLIDTGAMVGAITWEVVALPGAK